MAAKQDNVEEEPVSIRINRAKTNLRGCLAQISTINQLSGAIMELILDNLLLELRSNDLTTTINYYEEEYEKKEQELRKLQEQKGVQLSKSQTSSD